MQLSQNYRENAQGKTDYLFQSSLVKIQANTILDELFEEFAASSHFPESQISLAALAPAERITDNAPPDYLSVPYYPCTGEPFAQAALPPVSDGFVADGVAQLLSSCGFNEPTTVFASPPVANRTGPQPTLALNYPLLFGVACASLATTLGLWLYSQVSWQEQLAQKQLALAETPSASPSPNPADVEFARYMEQSLNTIAEESITTNVHASHIVATGPSTTPAASPEGTGGTGVVERIYIPVYQPPQVTTPQLATTAPVASIPVAPTSVALTPPQTLSRLPQLVTPPPGTLQRYLPTPPTVGSKIAPPQPGSQKSTPARPAITAAVAAQTAAPPPPANMTLVGVLELGERSVAMVEFNGTMQRMSIGQTLGSTGWQLVQIADQRAIIQRGEEVRSLIVGQKF